MIFKVPSSRAHILHTFSIINEKTLHTPNIKFVLFDMCKNQSFGNLITRLIYWFLTQNTNKCLEAYPYQWTPIHQIICNRNNFTSKTLHNLDPNNMCLSFSVMLISCIQLGHFVMVCKLQFYISLYLCLMQNSLQYS